MVVRRRAASTYLPRGCSGSPFYAQCLHPLSHDIPSEGMLGDHHFEHAVVARPRPEHGRASTTRISGQCRGGMIALLIGESSRLNRFARLPLERLRHLPTFHARRRKVSCVCPLTAGSRALMQGKMPTPEMKRVAHPRGCRVTFSMPPPWPLASVATVAARGHPQEASECLGG